MNSSVFKGLILATLSGVCLAFTAVIVKVSKHLHPGQLSIYRFIAILVMCLPETVKCGENPFGPKDIRLLLIIRGILGATNRFLGYMAFRYLPLGEASVIIFSAPVFITVAARVFLKEPCGISQSITVILTVTGILLTAKVPTLLTGSTVAVHTKENTYGLLAAFASLVFNTSQFIVLRKVKSCHHAVIIFNSSCVAVTETVFLTAIFGNFKWHSCGHQGLYIIILGFLSFAGQTLLTMALQCELAGPVSTMRSSADIVIAFVLQVVVFGDIPDTLSIVGAILVGISVIFVGLNKLLSLMPEDSSPKTKLSQIFYNVRNLFVKHILHNRSGYVTFR